MRESGQNIQTGSSLPDRLGLALSGGGFRASLFHIGVLAQMARLGLLRHVEAISTVSGGSIIGALYYLHAKRLLEDKTDEAVTDEDFIEIIQQIERDFLRAVQWNIRMRTFVNPLKNLRMVLPNYSRSDRIGELYDELIYRTVLDPSRQTLVELRELKIHPKGEPKGFRPLKDNARRKAKVPIILINATTLNTGHNWSFEATRMGETPRRGFVAQKIDKNLRLRRPSSYEAIVQQQQNIELGLAVAASACVPGLFHPLAISGLYPDGIRVQLVDGGVHDNQGVEALLETGCTRLVVSDASGQMEDELDPGTGLPSVVGRSNSILMDRVREEELFRVFDGKDAPVAFVHLCKGLSAKAVPWLGPDGQPAEATKPERVAAEPSEHFGVAQSVQRLLSKIRTDLDSFTDVEAYSLMFDAYAMTEPELRRAPGICDLLRKQPLSPQPQWDFLAIAPWLQKPTAVYQHHLEVGSQTVFKAFRLSLPLAVAGAIILVAFLAGLWGFFRDPILDGLATTVTIGSLLTMAAVLALGLVPMGSKIVSVIRFVRAPAEFLARMVIRGILPAVASVFVWLHLHTVDRLFLRLGRLERLGQPPS